MADDHPGPPAPRLLTRRSAVYGAVAVALGGAAVALDRLTPDRLTPDRTGPTSAAQPSVTSAPPAPAPAAPPTPASSSALPATAAGPAITVTLDGDLDALAVSPDERTLVVGTVGGDLAGWDLVTGRRRFGPVHDREFGVRDLAFSPDSRTVLSVGQPSDTVTSRWDAATGRRTVTPVVGGIFAVYGPGGDTVLTGSGYEWARIWDAATLTQLGGPLRVDSRVVLGGAFDPDGATLALVSGSGVVARFDARSHRRLSSFTVGEGLDQAAFSRDGRLIATALGVVVEVRALRTGAVVARRTVDRGADPIQSLAFSPDGTLLAVGDTGRVHVWRASDGTLVSDHSDWGNLASFTPRTGRLVIASARTVSVW